MGRRRRSLISKKPGRRASATPAPAPEHIADEPTELAGSAPPVMPDPTTEVTEAFSRGGENTPHGESLAPEEAHAPEAALPPAPEPDPPYEAVAPPPQQEGAPPDYATPESVESSGLSWSDPAPLDLGSSEPENQLGFDAEEESATVRYPTPERAPEEGIGFGMLGDFEDGGAPPTDEVPSAVLQDVSQPYTAPMNVPEPPPIPGILDRFTPAGAAPRSTPNPGGARAKKNRPSYIADTPTPPPMLQRQKSPTPGGYGGSYERSVDTYDDDDGGGGLMMTIGVLAMGSLGLVAVIVALLFVFMAWNRQDVSTTTIEEPAPKTVEPVAPKLEEFEGRAGVKVKVKEGLRGGSDDPKFAEPEPEPEPEPTPEPGAEPDAAPDPTPSADPSPRPDPAPTQPRPQPEPEPEPVEQADAQGVLKIRSNRKVLLYVDGKAIGYTPTTYKTDSGSHTVTAMLPGRPESKKEQNVSVSSGGVMPVNFTF